MYITNEFGIVLEWPDDLPIPDGCKVTKAKAPTAPKSRNKPKVVNDADKPASVKK